MYVEVPAIRYRDRMQNNEGDSSHTIKLRVNGARKKQYARFSETKTNSKMTSRDLKQFCPLNASCEDLLRQAIDVMGVSARAADRLLRVARTIADLEENSAIEAHHLLEAINFRNTI